MAHATRILVVSDDSQVGQWLLHRIGTLEGRHDCELDDTAGFERRLATTGTSAFDLLVAILDFAADAASRAQDWIEHTLGIPGMPPLVVLAQNGDESSAVGALRRGAVDYLPRRSLTSDLLAESISRARSSRPPQRAEGPAQAPPDMPSILHVPRNLIPRYTLLDTLGESARATVYLAHSAARNRHVALKVSRGAEDDEAQFSREFETLGSLRNPGIVDIYDYGLNDGREYIAMEYFPCGDLKARLQNPLSEHEALRYLHDIAAVLGTVHQHGILHRDLKPPNIMLREDATVVLIDFGIARNIDGGTRSTLAGVLRGSPYYMSPEQAQGADLDGRSDLYSLGVIFHEMLVGTKPYLGATAVEVLQQHVTAPVPQLPAELAHHQELLDALMAKDPDERFESADAVIAALQSEAA